MIPKIIHYCWFGRNPKSDIIMQCIESWKKYCPDYKIIEWNEDNFDVNCIQYTAQAYEKEKWAFVSDYARLAVVYSCGGIYLDTDVQLVNSINDLLKYDCWLASEDVRTVSTGLGFGAVKGNPVIKAMMENYEENQFDNIVNSVLDTLSLEKYFASWEKSNKSQLINGTYIVGMNDYGSYARHLATISWADDETRLKREEEIRSGKRSKPSVNVRIIWKMKCFLRSPKIISFFDKRQGSNLDKIYTFIAYDFLDYGPVYYLKRVIRKVYKFR